MLLHTVGKSAIDSPWGIIFKRMSGLYKLYKQQNVSHPRKASHTYEMYDLLKTTLTPIVNYTWVSSWPPGTMVPLCDSRHIQEIVNWIDDHDKIEWQKVDWTLLRYLIACKLDTYNRTPGIIPGFGTKVTYSMDEKIKVEESGEELPIRFWCGACGLSCERPNLPECRVCPKCGPEHWPEIPLVSRTDEL